MGEFALADSITGRPIRCDDRVVALLLHRQIVDHESAAYAIDVRAQNACRHYAPASLPVRARYDGFGGLDGVGDQFSALLVTSMTGTPDWEEFTAQHFTDGDAAHVPNCRDIGEDQHHFDLFVVHEATWDRLVPNTGAVQADVAKVIAAFDDALRPDGLEDDDLFALRVPLADFPKLPPLASAFAARPNGQAFADVFVMWLKDYSNLVAPSFLTEDTTTNNPQFIQLLGGLAEVLAFQDALDSMSLTFVPAPVISQHHEFASPGALATNALCVLEETVRDLFLVAEDGEPEDEEHKQLADIAQVMRAQLESVEARLRALADPDRDAD